MPSSKSRGHFRKTPKKVVVVPATKGRTDPMEQEQEKEPEPVGPPPPPKTGADEPPAEGTPRESPLGPGEHQDEPPTDEPKE